jgi:HEAT repeat protein
VDLVSKGNARRIAAAHSNVLDRVTAAVADPAIHTAAVDDGPALMCKAVALLSQQIEASLEQTLAQAIIGSGDYHHILLAPESTDAVQCLHAAEVLARHDSDFTAGLLRAADATAGAEGRALEIIERLGRTAVAAQWVRRMTEHPDPNVRSKAVKMLTCLHVNIALIERQMESGDARVRANAIEALWGEDSHRHRPLLERAALDPHHRVSANGLFGLFRANAPGIAERIARSARSGSPQHKAAIAWVMGNTGRPEFIPELEILEQNAEECVRSSAVRALQRIRACAAEAQGRNIP